MATVLQNSHLRSTLANSSEPPEERKQEDRIYFHYIDWSDTRENPAILTVDDFGELVNSDRAFCRKVSDEKSIALLDKIDDLARDSEFSRKVIESCVSRGY